MCLPRRIAICLFFSAVQHLIGNRISSQMERDCVRERADQYRKPPYPPKKKTGRRRRRVSNVHCAKEGWPHRGGGVSPGTAQQGNNSIISSTAATKIAARAGFSPDTKAQGRAAAVGCRIHQGLAILSIHLISLQGAPIAPSPCCCSHWFSLSLPRPRFPLYQLRSNPASCRRSLSL